MADCPFCADVEAPPGSCPLHGHQEPRWRPDPPPLPRRPRRPRPDITAIRQEAYNNGWRDGHLSGIVVGSLVVLFVVAVIWMVIYVG